MNMDDKKASRFGLGLVIGSVIGSIAGLLLSPRTGKQNRAMFNKKMKEWKKMMESGELESKVKEIFGDVSDESVRMYATVREQVMQGIETLKHMDGDDYARMVQNVIDEVKKGGKLNAVKMRRLKESFIKDWPHMKEEVEKETKKISESVPNGSKEKKPN